MNIAGVREHPIGTPSLGAVLDVGLKCVHSCRFCYYSYYDGGPDQFKALRKARFRSREDCLEIVRLLAEHGMRHLDMTGGEPSLHPAVVDVAALAATLALPSRLITLGQLLLRKKHGDRLLDRLLAAGLTDFLFSLHAPGRTLFADLCGGDLDRLLETMSRLDADGVQYGVNTVITSKNVRRLPEIARLSVSHAVYVHNFIFFNAYHAWRGSDHAAELQVPYADAAGFLEEAVALLEENDRAVNIRYTPLCAVPKLARHVVGALGVAFDPYEWRNRCMCHDSEPKYCAEPLPVPENGVPERYAFSELDEVRNGTRLIGMRGRGFKHFVAACRDCPARPACDGIDPTYLDRFGDREFRPIDEETQGSLLRSHLAYAPAFLMKTEQKADMLAALRACGVSSHHR